MPLQTIISGGQTGVDRAALDCAMACGLAGGGWCPRGRRAEDGVIDAHYPLRETPSRHYRQRTEWNVRDADGTLILTFGAPTGGTLYTLGCAQRLGRPHLVVDLHTPDAATHAARWLQAHDFQTLNIAGPREASPPGTIYQRAFQLLRLLLAEHYLDDTGLMVFTTMYLLKRGTCCHSGCRHCPY